ncbi:homoserine dehydrogenase [Christensenellaceae bacterium NSJ-63]|uniref:Homoserine dehydrogenase n=1 Tax=Guopingia tenuis TaxID=2763656 RepID=A0A926HXH2_9FIRM|nr:homoserine dehydrogenase [Guopingia tenuis]MBC8538761.1 homoserine dehydrogenase [Guopingia tenuis]MBS5644829.1 homoserine dehydrogenase [Clostridiales bacterium]
MKNVKIGIMGMGTVGSGVYRVVEQEGNYIAHKEGMRLEVKKVLALQYSIDIPEEKKAASVDELANDPEISIVVEVMGGIEPAKSFITKMLEAGKTVVTANKELIAKHWPELEKVAKEHNVGLYFEASVGGGIPILRAVSDSLQANTITSVLGIINGTTNYILTKMCDEGGDFEEVLREAQRLGYAEANPTNDVDGFDAMYKLSILASMAFHVRLPIDHIYREGIRGISKTDIACAKELGYEVKLLAIAKREGELVQMRVHPTMVKTSHPLANIKDSFNAILLHGSAVDDVMFYGRGAGDFPTASAILSDVICAAKTAEHKYMTFMNDEVRISPTLCFENNWTTRFFIRMNVEDKPGMLSKITKVLGDSDVSLHSVMQKGQVGSVATIIFVTHEAKELYVKKALEEIQEKNLAEVCSLIRVED